MKNTLSLEKWMDEQHEQIESHVAYHHGITVTKAEELLKGKEPFTYLFRSTGMNDFYIMSFVEADGSIDHRPCYVQLTNKGWRFENNSSCRYPNGIRAENIADFIAMVMHCEKQPHVCKPLQYNV